MDEPPYNSGKVSRSDREIGKLSLSVRVLLAVFVALALSASLGAGLTLWQEGRGVRIELQASLAAAVNVVQQAEERGPQPPSRLASLFDGDRHLVATVESGGRILARSTLFSRNT